MSGADEREARASVAATAIVGVAASAAVGVAAFAIAAFAAVGVAAIAAAIVTVGAAAAIAARPLLLLVVPIPGYMGNLEFGLSHRVLPPGVVDDIETVLHPPSVLTTEKFDVINVARVCVALN